MYVDVVVRVWVVRACLAESIGTILPVSFEVTGASDMPEKNKKRHASVGWGGLVVRRLTH